MNIPSEPTPRLVIIKNVAPDTTETMLTDFFSFCGKINDFCLNHDTTAYILFERPAAARTAMLLNNATVNGREVVVEAYFPQFKEAASSEEEEQPDQREQEAKPKSNIMAEILAAGYKLTDPIIHAASDFDKKYGVWNRVEPYWTQVDQKLHVAKTVHSIEDSTDHWLKESAMGQRVQHHLVDPISSAHTVARRLVDEQSGERASR